jgi:hypothetical protein
MELVLVFCISCEEIEEREGCFYEGIEEREGGFWGDAGKRDLGKRDLGSVTT